MIVPVPNPVNANFRLFLYLSCTKIRPSQHKEDDAMTAVKKISPVQPTKAQREWLEEEAKRTGNSIATVVRALIQEKISQKEG